MKRLIFWVLLFFGLFGLIFLLVKKRVEYRCERDPVVGELLFYRPRSYEELKLLEPKFLFSGDFGSKKVSRPNVVDILKKIKVSVILGKKEYLLIGSFFVEKGGELNGIKFLGVEDGKVVLEIDGKKYYKAY